MTTIIITHAGGAVTRATLPAAPSPEAITALNRRLNTTPLDLHRITILIWIVAQGGTVNP